MADRTSRAFFVAEFVVLALPTLAALGSYAVIMAGYALFALGAALYAVVAALLDFAPMGDDGDPLVALGVAVAALAGAVLPVAGLIAIWAFARVALVFTLRGRREIGRMRPVFRRGLIWAIAPLVLTVPLGLMTAVSGEGLIDVVAGLVLSGAPLVIPGLHLAVEISDAPPPVGV